MDDNVVFNNNIYHPCCLGSWFQPLKKRGNCVQPSCIFNSMSITRILTSHSCPVACCFGCLYFSAMKSIYQLLMSYFHNDWGVMVSDFLKIYRYKKVFWKYSLDPPPPTPLLLIWYWSTCKLILNLMKHVNELYSYSVSLILFHHS